MNYILVLDVGTTNIKGLAFSKDGELLKDKEIKTEPIFPKPGWVEQDPKKVMDTVYEILDHMEDKLGKSSGVAITNQRSSSVVWDKETGEPLYNMITWQDTRTKELVEEYSSKSMVKFGKFMGDVVNKIGTSTLAVAAQERGVPVMVAAQSLKLHPDALTGHAVDVEMRKGSEVIDDPIRSQIGEIEVENPVSDVTPPAYIDAIITERGQFPPESIITLMRELYGETTAEAWEFDGAPL